VVAEYQAAPHGRKAAVLRREGIYQSQIREWAIVRDALAGGPAAPRRPHRATASSGKDDPGRLRAENQRLTREPARSQAVVEIMGKLQGLLEAISESTDTPSPPATRLRRAARRGSAHQAGLRAGRAGAGHPLPPRPGGRCTARSRPG